MAEVRGQRQDLAIDIGAVFDPVQESPYGKRVPQIVNARAAGASLCRPVEAPPESAERLLDGGTGQGGRAIRAEETIRPPHGAAGIAGLSVPDERPGSGRVERDEAGRAELALPNGEDAAIQIDVVAREPAGLGHPQSGRGEEREERDVGLRAKAVVRPETASVSKEREDFSLAVNMGRLSACEAPQESAGRDLGGGVDCRAVSRERSQGQTSVASLVPGRGSVSSAPTGPRDPSSMPVVPDSVGALCEAPEQPPRPVGVETQPASDGQVLVDEREETRRCHGVTSGQGRATCQSAGRSSLA